MELQQAEVQHRITELRRTAARPAGPRRARRDPLAPVRHALGRRLLAWGQALLASGASVPSATAARR
jgi:hypothetical protein